MKFEWDQNKADSNLSKHGVSFNEATTVFDDPFYLDFFDPDHSFGENRYIIIGQSFFMENATKRGTIGLLLENLKNI